MESMGMRLGSDRNKWKLFDIPGIQMDGNATDMG